MRPLQLFPGLLAAAFFAAACQQSVEAAAEAAEPAEEPKPLVLVAGATGGTGSLVVAELLKQGYPVRAFVRDAAKALERLGPEVEAVAGDLKDVASIAAALDGVGAVINAAGAGAGGGEDNTPEKVDYEGARNLAEAAHAAGASQYVLVSSRGVTDDDHYLNRMFNNVLKWKRKGEEAVAASGIDYTIVRPGGLGDGEGGGQTIVFEQGDNRSEGIFINRADVARVCVAALQHDAARNKVFEIRAADGEPQADFGPDFEALSGS
ncbi:MAG: SDR family oxidoreductase [Gammaproteobacteria bacterium]|nr:SDR family oxidoreductase [Gammaproteobacteria bacterium]